jgi:hypothetical protein
LCRSHHHHRCSVPCTQLPHTPRAAIPGPPGLYGTLPEGIFNLPQLVELNLQLNRLTGRLPSNMCAVNSNLTVLSVKNNLLTGPVRALRNCTKLALLDLSVSPAAQGRCFRCLFFTEVLQRSQGLVLRVIISKDNGKTWFTYE